MSKWMPILVTIGLGALGTVTPQIQSAITAHPGVAVGLGALYAILHSLLPSPMTGGNIGSSGSQQ